MQKAASLSVFERGVARLFFTTIISQVAIEENAKENQRVWFKMRKLKYSLSAFPFSTSCDAAPLSGVFLGMELDCRNFRTPVQPHQALSDLSATRISCHKSVRARSHRETGKGRGLEEISQAYI